MRIASLQPSITITLAALDRLDTLCAITKYCLESLPELAARNLPILHDSWSFDKPGTIETLLAAKPDAVIASVPYRMESLAAILKSGLPVLTLAPHSLADIYTDIRLIAGVAQADPEPIIANMQRTIDDTCVRTAHLAPAEKPLIYCEEWGKPLIHSQHWVAELVEAAGGRFLGTPGSHTTAKEIAAADPDVLLFAWCGAGDRVPLDRVIVQRNWQSLRAVRAGRVHCIPDEYLNTPAPTLLQGLACIATAAFPELFPSHPRLVTLKERPVVLVDNFSGVRGDTCALAVPTETPNPQSG
jgi:iron complex transport system substrate-binding protein